MCNATQLLKCETDSAFNVNAARALAQRTLTEGKNYSYPLKKFAEAVGFNTVYEWVNDDGQVKDRTIVLPSSVKEQMQHEFPDIGFKKVESVVGRDEVLVYRRL